MVSPAAPTSTEKKTPATKQKGRGRKVSQYGAQLKEKQALRNAYGLREKPFRRYYQKAARFKGSTGAVLLSMLETRLDNVLYRTALVKSRAQARQLITHRHLFINGRQVSSPSYTVKAGDTITFRHPSLDLYSQELTLAPAGWLDINQKTMTIKVKKLPETNDLPIEFDTQKIIEFYSK